MPLTADYYLKRAEEIELAARKTTDPVLRRAQEDLGRALRALAAMISQEGDKAKQSAQENGDNGLPTPH